MRKIVVSGAPCAGKTKTIESLRKMGFICLPENARIIFKSGLFDRGAPWHMKKFQDASYNFQNEIERLLTYRGFKDDDVVFLDKGMYEMVVYHTVFDMEVPSYLQYELKRHKPRYDAAVILDMLPYKDDGLRTYEELRHKIHDEICRVYRLVGIPTLSVPVTDIDTRREMIMRFVDGDLS